MAEPRRSRAAHHSPPVLVDREVREPHDLRVFVRGLRAFVVGLVLVGISACGSSTPAPAGTSPTPTTPTPTLGPSTSTFTLTGDGSLSGSPLTSLTVACFVPAFNGELIIANGQVGQQADAPYVTVTIASDKVTVSEAAGNAATYSSRSFSGTGVSGFDPSKGGRVAGPLTEDTSSVAKGTLGAFAAITGSVSCGNQTAGTTTIKVSGSTAEGTVGAFTETRVACATTKFGQGVQVSALTAIGGHPALLFISIEKYINDPSVANAPAFSMNQTFANAPGHFYTRTPGNGTFAVTQTSGHVDGDVTEQVAAGATPHTLHITGDATCGSSSTTP